MKLFPTICFLLISATGFAQRSEKFKVPYNHRCGIENACHDCTDTVARFKGNIGKYFSKNMNWRVMEQITGVILVDIAVDASGHTCCYNIYNYTVNDNSTILALGLGSLINTMPVWKPGMKNQEPVSTIRTIAIYSFVKGHPTFEVSYIRGDKAIQWQPSRELEEVRKTIGTSEIDNNFNPDKVKENNR